MGGNIFVDLSLFVVLYNINKLHEKNLIQYFFVGLSILLVYAVTPKSTILTSVFILITEASEWIIK